MSKLFKLSTIVLFLGYSASSFSQQCTEDKIGTYKKTLWDLNIDDGLRGEIVNQIARKDDLFEKLAPEIEFGISPVVDFRLEFKRKVRDHLPAPVGGKITSSDLFSYRIQNELNLEFVGKVSSGLLFSEGKAGVNLRHSTDLYPGKEKTACELYQSLVDKENEVGNALVSAACSARAKSKLTKAYESSVNFFSQKTGKIFNSFSDNERNVLFAKDPLSPLKLHSTLGVPMDYKVFFENNSDIAIGDIVEHTSYYAIKPLGLQADIFSFMRPSVAKFYRVLRTLAFKKVLGNKVIVDVEDTLLSGDSLEVFKLRPKILYLLKLNLGRWASDSFHEENLVQRFEIDLNKESGVEFFKKILFSAYTPSLDLHEESVLVDHEEYKNAVVAYNPIYSNGFGNDRRFHLKLPGTFAYENRSYFDLKDHKFGNHHYTTGNKFHKKRFQFKFDLDFKLFKLNTKSDESYECSMSFDKNQVLVNNSNIMNIDCHYHNRFAQKNEVKQIKESLLMTLNGNVEKDVLEQLNTLKYKKRTPIDYYTNLSFSHEVLKNILNKSDDQIYDELSKMLFGENAQNIFAKKYHRLWKKAKSDRSKSVIKNSKLYRDCSVMLYSYGITSKQEDMYDELKGIAGSRKGLEGSGKKYLCYSYFRKARSIVKDIRHLKESLKADQLNDDTLDVFSGLNNVGIIQNLLVRLSDKGLDGDSGIRFQYAIASPELKTSIIRMNNPDKYEIEIPGIPSSLSRKMRPISVNRIGMIDVFNNSCHSDKIKIHLDLNYPIHDRGDILLEVKVSKFSLLSENILETVRIPIRNYDLFRDNKFIYNIQLDRDLELDQSHVLYLRLVNKDGHSLSRETKTYLKEIPSIRE